MAGNSPIRDLRYSQDWSQEHLANLIGTSQNIISCVERTYDYDLSGRAAMRLSIVAGAVGRRLPLSDIYPSWFASKRHETWLINLQRQGVDGGQFVKAIPIRGDAGARSGDFEAWFAGQVQIGRLKPKDKGAAYAGWEARA